MIKLRDVLSEVYPVGKVQQALLQYLQSALKGAHSGKVEVSLSQLARHPSFRGVHFKRIQSAKALAKKGLIWYDGCCNVRLEKQAGE